MGRARADWDNDVTKMFLDLCIAEKEKLNYNAKKGPTKVGWQNIYRNFRQQTGRSYDDKQLRNKFQSLKRLYRVWRNLKNKSGAGWNNRIGTISMDDEWWDARIVENAASEMFRTRALPHENEMTILFTNMDTEEDNMLCIGGIGDRTPSGGSEDNCTPVSDDNVGGSSVGSATHGSGKEQVVDSPPPKRTKSMEYYVERISESMLERNRIVSTAMSREQDEVIELLNVLQQDGVDKRSELYFIATELLRSGTRRASFRTLDSPESRKEWLEWTWEKTRNK